MRKHARFVVVSNRLPVVIERNSDGLRAIPGSGGLISAMTPVLRARGGMWIGWPGHSDGVPEPEVLQTLEAGSADWGFDLVPVFLPEDVATGYYDGFSNATIWPLFHDLQGRTVFEIAYHKAYLDANRMFADCVESCTEERDFVWVHDYHLMDVARFLREHGTKRTCAFFLHIPFPPPDIFMKLPWRREILEALFHYDLLGFQTFRDRRNFLDCVDDISPCSHPSGRGNVIRIRRENRQVGLGVFPIGIDAREFENISRSASAHLAEQSVRETAGNRKIILGVDRLDYTKGIPHRLKAFEKALGTHPELCGNVTFLQIAVPSREGVEGYLPLRREIEQIAGHINGRFTSSGWVPVVLMVRGVNREELVAHYRAADVAMVTPLKDGMNLVCKEYCAARTDGAGVLVLSEFAGAAAQLYRGAMLVNPHDIDGTADAIAEAVSMPRKEQRRRMRLLRNTIRQKDVYWWMDTFIQVASGRKASEFFDGESLRPYPQFLYKGEATDVTPSPPAGSSGRPGSRTAAPVRAEPS
jgi:alpha,alpha-trehalose-phosphate synthase [UDP-forming]